MSSSSQLNNLGCQNSLMDRLTIPIRPPYPALFGSNIDSAALLLPATVSSVGTSSPNAGMSSMPLGDSVFQNSLYSYMQELLHGTGQDSPSPARTLMKVYKSGCVGRSSDISSYHELRQELGQMFGIQGFLKTLKDEAGNLYSWEAFVNNVWYIKILSPEDLQKLGKQEAESLSRISAERLSSCGGTDGRHMVSRFPSLGSLEY